MATRSDTADTYDRDAAARSALYALLARAFDNPDREFHAAATDGDLAREVDTYLERSSLSVERPRLETEQGYEELCGTYNRLFTLGHAEYTDRTDGSLESEGPPVPLYESKYRDVDWNAINVDLARAYEHFGLSVSSEERDHHDNLRLELEFAAYLARREAAGETDAARARRDFLDRHLDPFATALERRLEDVEATFYADLARLLERVVSSDSRDLRERYGASDHD
ncbi:molecular chaperone TorD family protein [Halapricum hydrolyticum]|uniref:Molecular chaperone TorD family protein n=1 Tax=Halapricum hydrolyticum TaxID=2979991 RepID=A0AAE3I8S1_9EURY|nr:molecular chaperone TorD family protein [Halapricum hydrolyticum]MCU4716953.1 molecular chaperone TorD family protein [Halapricum hydrolyticum]MCU4725442.1 molecular chaperone TorD family protein [Halapricum hydrolyticum]